MTTFKTLDDLGDIRGQPVLVREDLNVPMAGNWETSLAFQAACELVFRAVEQPNGYTEPLLHAWRLRKKAIT